MRNPKAYQSYFGGKESPGAYQTQINNIPVHDAFASLYLGNCAVTRHIKLAGTLFLNDIDHLVFEAWKPIVLAFPKGDIRLSNVDALERLKLIFLAASSRLDIKYFIYLDPPYPFITRKSVRPVYRHEMGDVPAHVELLNAITSCKLPNVYIMICSYPNDIYDMYLSEWTTVDYQSTTRNGLAWERIYMNYPPPTELHDYRYFGGNFRQREQFKRIVASLVKKVQKVPEGLRQSVIDDILLSLNTLKNGN